MPLMFSRAELRMRRSPGAGRLRGGLAQAARDADATARIRISDSIQRCASSWASARREARAEASESNERQAETMHKLTDQITFARA